MILNYNVQGEGKPLVVLHGLLGNLQNLAASAKFLADYFQVISLDLRNHGRSQHASSHTYQEMANDVLETIATLNIDKFSILGHSMGGKAAMTLALNHPQTVDRLIVEDIAPVTYPNRHQTIFDGLKAIELSTLNNRQEADKILANYVEDLGVRRFLLTNLYQQESNWQWKMALDTLINQYPNICGFDTNPTQQFVGETLFVKGGDSEYIRAEHQPIIHQLFPNAKAKIIQGTGHWIHAEKAAIFNKVVLDFLQR